MIGWIRFALTAVFLISAVFSFVCVVIGVSRFGFVLNRLHAAGIGDTMGLFFTAVSLIIATGFAADSLKIILLIFFMWFTSPVSTHFVAQVEYFTNRHLDRYVRYEGEAELGTDTDGNH